MASCRNGLACRYRTLPAIPGRATANRAGLAVSVGSHQRLAQVQESRSTCVRREAEEDWGKRGWR